MAQEIRSPRTLRLAGRSFLAFVLAPEPPIPEWLTELDAWIGRSTGFFAGRPVILDLSSLTLTKPAASGLLAEPARPVSLRSASPSCARQG